MTMVPLKFGCLPDQLNQYFYENFINLQLLFNITLGKNYDFKSRDFKIVLFLINKTVKASAYPIIYVPTLFLYHYSD